MIRRETKVEQPLERDEHLRWVTRTIGFGLLFQLTLAGLGVTLRDENPTPPPKPEEQPAFLVGSVQRVVDVPDTSMGTFDYLVMTTCLDSQELIDALTTAKSTRTHQVALDNVLECDGPVSSIRLGRNLSEMPSDYVPHVGDVTVTSRVEHAVWILDSECPPYGKEQWELENCVVK